MDREAIELVIDALESGERPRITVEDVPAFKAGAAAGSEHASPAALEEIAAGLTAADVPTFRRALRAIDEGELAWLGFKVVYDPAAAVSNADNEVTKRHGDVGSADGEPLVFFCNDAKEIVCSREPSPRDVFQMKDVTRGPSMHNEQFDGLVWASVALFEPVRVWLLGASDVACELEKLAVHVGFEVTAVDYDPAYLNERRFPLSERVLLGDGDFSGLSALSAEPADYVCVLTRGHMFDPDGCLWALRQGARHIGMMGCAGKNDKVRELAAAEGMTDAQWAAVKRPIGLKFGAKTPAEIAISIVAELIDVRYRDRYSAEARERHDRGLGW